MGMQKEYVMTSLKAERKTMSCLFERLSNALADEAP